MAGPACIIDFDLRTRTSDWPREAKQIVFFAFTTRLHNTRLSTKKNIALLSALCVAQ